MAAAAPTPAAAAAAAPTAEELIGSALTRLRKAASGRKHAALLDAAKELQDRKSVV